MTIEDVDRQTQQEQARAQQEQARALWLESAATGKPITGSELGRRFGKSDRWGRDRAAEARGYEVEDTGEIPVVRDAETGGGSETGSGNGNGGNRQSPAVAEPAAAAVFGIPAGPAEWQRADEAPAALPGLVNGSNGHAGLPHQRQEARPMQPLSSIPPVVSTSSDAENRRKETEAAEESLPPLPPPPAWERAALIALSLVFLVPGLGISAWSFYGYARHANAPVLLAGSASAAIDGIGLWAAFFAARFTNRGQSARFPRMVTYAMIAASVYINWEHATSQHWSTGLHVLVSAPAVAAASAFEVLMLEMRINERARHEKRRRARMSAKVDPDMWVHHPLMVWGARRWESRDRIQEIFPGYKQDQR